MSEYFCNDVWQIIRTMIIVDFVLYEIRCETCCDTLHIWAELNNDLPKCPNCKKHKFLYSKVLDIMNANNRILILKNNLEFNGVEFEIVNI